MTLADVAHAEGAVRQDAENSAHYRPVRFAAGHHDHHLAGGVQEDPASPAASNHRRMNFPLHFDYNYFFFPIFDWIEKKWNFLLQKLVTDLQSGKTLLNSDDSEEE